jgi:hypothetical protein
MRYGDINQLRSVDLLYLFHSLYVCLIFGLKSVIIQVVFTNPSMELYDSIMGDSKKSVVESAMKVQSTITPFITDSLTTTLL